MIVILNDQKVNLVIRPGDTIEIKYNNTILSKDIATEKFNINRLICFIFVDEDGTCLSPNISYSFIDELPKELEEATPLLDLDSDKRLNLYNTCPIQLS